MSEWTGDIGKGVIGGVLGLILGVLGFKSRLNAIEKGIEKRVHEGTCTAVHAGLAELAKMDHLAAKNTNDAIWNKLDRMDDKLDRMIEKILEDNSHG
ncbi:MAG: hypothetical protein V3S49_04865 [Thermodesulfobacteriota bacterium]